MPILLQAIDPAADAAAVAACNMRSFWVDAHWRHQWGDTPLDQIVADITKTTPWNLISNRPVKRFLKAVDTDSGTLVGYARWILPDSVVGEICWAETIVAEPSKEQRAYWTAQRESVLDSSTRMTRGLNAAMVRKLGGPPDAADKRIRQKYAGRECLELDYLAVHQEWQGRGIGKMLVRKGLEVARELGLHYLIMGFTVSGRALYDRLPELTKEKEVVQSCEEWPTGRQAGCACVAGFYVGIYKEGN